jgi:SAM-dependent methyltransferase
LTFKDHFSERAANYAVYRPRYPETLFQFLAGLSPEHRTVLDCGTGNGQAAIGLVTHFDRVIATDPSAEQISHAAPHKRIEYRIARAESSGLPAESADLVTAAQALHWFDAKSFFEEARRVLVPGGAIAIWGYGDPILDTSELDQILRAFNRGLLEPYWFPERKLLLGGYRAVAFPFDEVAAPKLELEMNWSLPELAGYLRTWSSAARYMAENGVDPVLEVEKSLATHWGESASTRLIRWPLYLRAGKLPIGGHTTNS